MGTLRLVLAILVLLSHADVRVAGYNPGVVAVVVFYLISGYVMAGLVRAHYSTPARMLGFYADRALRIYPQYIFYAAAALLWQLATNARTAYLTHLPTAVDILNNAAVIPLNFFMFNGADKYSLVPPAWSLGAELQFYLMAPVLVLWPRIGAALAGLSLVVHGLAAATVLDSDWFGYRLLAGVLWIFAAGVLMFHLRESRSVLLRRGLALGAPLAALALLAVLRGRGLADVPYNTELLVGWGIGIPLVTILGARQSGRWDHLAGDISYGVFLNHFLVMWLLFPQHPSAGQLPIVVACSIAASYVTQRWLEQPAVALRRRLRRTKL